MSDNRDALETRTAAVHLRAAADPPGTRSEPAIRPPMLRGAGLEHAIEEHLLGDAEYATCDLMAACRMEIGRLERLRTRLGDYGMAQLASLDGTP